MSQIARASNHEEPTGAVAIARHYIRDLIYGANDGLITTFAVVAAVSGGALSTRTVLIVGMANLLADVVGRLTRLGFRATGTSGRRAYGAELSPRERDVVRLVAQGRTNRQIAQELVLSSKTVANHVATARGKLSAPSRTALAVTAIAAGLIEHPAEERPRS